MKRTISMTLALIVMTLTVISPSVSAAETANPPTEDLIVTATQTVSTKDENGEWVVLENYTYQVSEDELDDMQSPPGENDITPLAISYIQHRYNYPFENGNIELSLNAKFEYEPGSHVDCVSKTGSITQNKNGWIIMSKTISSSKNALGTKATATMKVVFKTTAGQERSYDISISCNRSGTLSFDHS